MKILAGSNVSRGLKKSGVSALDKGIPFGFEFRSEIASEYTSSMRHCIFLCCFLKNRLLHTT
jgi:hypothetical protein